MKKTVLLLGVAVLALSACSSDKGPGEIGSKEDIVVKNNGMPQATQAAESGDFTSTTEQAAAIPAPEVAPAEPLPDNSPAVTAAVQEREEANALLPSPAAEAASDKTAPDQKPIDAIASSTPVTNETLQPPVQEQTAAAPPVYPKTDYPAEPAAAATAPEIAPAAAPPVLVDLKDPAVIRSAQATLKLKGVYNGAEDGAIDAVFLNALSSYQAKNGLPQGGLNEATLRHLGVIE